MLDMAKVIIAYVSKWGNTKQAAEAIAEGMKQVEGMKVVLSELKEIDPAKVPDYDAILIGSPNHFGGPIKSIKKFINKLGKLDLKGKHFAVFDTYLAKDFEKAVKKMEKQIAEKVPELKPIVSGLSIQVQGMKGPIKEGEFPKCKEFGNKIATQIKT